MANRPNIVLITSDQQRGDCFGFEGRKVKTPHLDMLAQGGTRFSTCITPHVICQPARASILTGLLPLTHGVRDNGFDLPEMYAEEGFAGRLAASGYKTAFIGKAHFKCVQTFRPTGSPECIHSREQYGDNWFGPFMGFEHTELISMGHYTSYPPPRPLGQHYESWYYSDGCGAVRNRLLETRLSPDYGAPQTHNSALPTVWHNSTWVGDRAINYFAENRNAPFCVWLSFPDPHHPFDCPDPWCFSHHPDDVDLPPYREIVLHGKPWWHAESLTDPTKTSSAHDRVARENYDKMAPGYGRVAPKEEIKLRQIIANYYGMISLIDHNVGRIVTSLRDLGILDNTIIIYTSDHGEWLGDHGLIQKGPILLDGLLRVGLIIQGPGFPKGQIIEEPVSTIDLAPTILDFAETRSQSAMHGRSLKKMLLKEANDTRDFAYGEWDTDPGRFGIKAALRLRTVRTRSHRLTVDLNSGAGELYDLKNDPYELDNLFNDPCRVAIQTELIDAIRARPSDERTPPLIRVGAY